MKLETGVQNSGYYYATILDGNELTEIEESTEDGINRECTVHISDKKLKAIHERLRDRYADSPKYYTFTE